MNRKLLSAFFCAAFAFRALANPVIDHIVPITPIKNVDDTTLPSLPSGLTTFAGVTFDLPDSRPIWLGNLPGSPSDLSATLTQNIAYASSVRLLILTGNTFTSQMSVGDQIGRVVLQFDSGLPITIPLVVGLNIREWEIGRPVPMITTSTDSSLQEVWRGTSVSGYTAVVDMLTVPLDGTRTLQSIAIFDESQSRIGQEFPILALRAVTVQSLSDPSQPNGTTIAMYAGITINGTIGDRIYLEYTNDLSTSSWSPLVDFTLTVSPFTYFDQQSAGVARRFYRSRAVRTGS